jgi:hypothetical protein
MSTRPHLPPEVKRNDSSTNAVGAYTWACDRSPCPLRFLCPENLRWRLRLKGKLSVKMDADKLRRVIAFNIRPLGFGQFGEHVTDMNGDFIAGMRGLPHSVLVRLDATQVISIALVSLHFSMQYNTQ